MNSDVIALLVDRVDVHDVLYGAGQHPCRVDGDERVVSVYFHSESCSRIRYLAADRAESDDTELFALDLISCKGFLALFHLLCDIFLTCMLSAPFHAADDVSGCQEQACKYKLFYTVLICTWCVEYNDSLFRALIERDVVDSGSGSRDRLKSLREFCLMKGCAADHDSFRIFDVIYKCIISCEAVCTVVGDLI